MYLRAWFRYTRRGATRSTSTVAAAFTEGTGDWWMRLCWTLVNTGSGSRPGATPPYGFPRHHKGALNLNSMQVTATTDSDLSQDPVDELVPIR